MENGAGNPAISGVDKAVAACRGGPPAVAQYRDSTVACDAKGGPP